MHSLEHGVSGKKKLLSLTSLFLGEPDTAPTVYTLLSLPIAHTRHPDVSGPYGQCRRVCGSSCFHLHPARVRRALISVERRMWDGREFVHIRAAVGKPLDKAPGLATAGQKRAEGLFARAPRFSFVARHALSEYLQASSKAVARSSVDRPAAMEGVLFFKWNRCLPTRPISTRLRRSFAHARERA